MSLQKTSKGETNIEWAKTILLRAALAGLWGNITFRVRNGCIETCETTITEKPPAADANSLAPVRETA